MSDHQQGLTAAFVGGASFSGLSSITIWDLRIDPMSFPVEIAMKVIATMILSAIGGVFGMLARDVYTYYIKPKIKKFK